MKTKLWPRKHASTPTKPNLRVVGSVSRKCTRLDHTTASLVLTRKAYVLCVASRSLIQKVTNSLQHDLNRNSDVTMFSAFVK